VNGRSEVIREIKTTLKLTNFGGQSSEAARNAVREIVVHILYNMTPETI
jgi:hypothetical protein